jgi:hypothetical protein
MNISFKQIAESTNPLLIRAQSSLKSADKYLEKLIAQMAVDAKKGEYKSVRSGCITVNDMLNQIKRAEDKIKHEESKELK